MGVKNIFFRIGVKNSSNAFTAGAWSPRGCPAWQNTSRSTIFFKATLNNGSGQVLNEGTNYYVNYQGSRPASGDYADVGGGIVVGTTAEHYFSIPYLCTVLSPAGFYGYGGCKIEVQAYIYVQAFWEIDNPNSIFYSWYNLPSVSSVSVSSTSLTLISTDSSDGSKIYSVYVDFRGLPIPSDHYPFDDPRVDLGINIKKATHIVTYDANGGTVSPSSDSSYYGSAVTLPTPVRTGYSCNGWYTAASGGTRVGRPGDSYVPLYSITLYAQWTISTYTITFNANGGTGTMSAQTVLYNTPTPLTANSFQRSGYVFWKWNTSAGGIGTSYADQANITLTDDITLYAQWAPNILYVTFNSCGGSTPDPTTKSYNYTSSGYGTYGTLPGNITLSGYTFVGWFTTQNVQVSSSSVIEIWDNHSLYARWENASVTVTFNANGGTVTETTRSVRQGDPYGGLPIPTRQGYSFVGWFTQSTGGTQVFANDIVVASITLYAHWIDGTLAWWAVY